MVLAISLINILNNSFFPSAAAKIYFVKDIKNSVHLSLILLNFPASSIFAETSRATHVLHEATLHKMETEVVLASLFLHSLDVLLLLVLATKSWHSEYT